jgi:putative membrane protein
MFDPGAWGAVEVLVWVVVAVVAALLVVLVAHAVGAGWRTGPSRDGAGRPPLEILEDRYARGELSDEEFERRRQGLTRAG